MGLKQYDRHSAAVLKSARWKSVRYLAKKRDGWKCRDCGASGRLEVHHIKRVRDYPELAYDLDNLKSLCGSCHSRITRIEVGLDPLDPARQAWRAAIRALLPSTKKKASNASVSHDHPKAVLDPQ